MSRRRQALHRVLDQEVDDRVERFLAVGALRERLLVTLKLSIGAGPPFQDFARALDFLHAIEAFGVLAHEIENLLQQQRVGNQGTLAKVDKIALYAVALGPPAVLVNEDSGIHPPAHVPEAQSVEHADDTLEQGGDGDGVPESRADVGNAHFQGRKAGTETNVEPQFGGILDDPGADQLPDHALIFPVTVESLGNTRSRHRVEYRQTVGFQARVLALPERRRGAQGQEVGQEVADLVHQIDAQVVVGDAHVDVHAANEQPPDRPLHVAREGVVPLLWDVVLLFPTGEGMGRGRDRRQAVAAGDFRDRGAQARQIGTGLPDPAANPGSDLDLGPHELGRDLPPEQGFALGHHRVRRFGGEIATEPIDEKVFFLDSDREFGFPHRHSPRFATR